METTINLAGKKLTVKLNFENNQLTGLEETNYDVKIVFPLPVITREEIPIDLIFDFIKQLELKAQLSPAQVEDLFREVNEILNQQLGVRLQYTGPNVEIVVRASDGFTVPATNFFVKWKNEYLVGELTYVHVFKRVRREKRRRIEFEEFETVEPLLITNKWTDKNNEKGYYFISVPEQRNQLAVNGRPINLEVKSIGNAGIPTLMKYETVAQFFATSKVIEPREIYPKLKEKIKEFVSFDWDERLYDLACCYIIGTYFYDVFYSYPILVFFGDFETGKTRALKTVVYASHRGMLCVDPTVASMFRTVDAYRPTFGIDEFTKLTEDIQRIARASYKKGEKVPRIEKAKHERFILSLFEVFTPFVLATTEKIPDMLLSRCIQVTMKRAEDPNPEKRDPEPEDFEDIREMLYLSRLTFAKNVYEASKELDNLKLGLRGREYEVWKPILTIAKLLGEDVFNNVLSLAKDLIEERKEQLHHEERLLLQVIGNFFVEKYGTTLEGEKQVEFTASDVLGALKEEILLDEYGEDEKRFYKDWNVQKIGIRLTRMGLRKTRKGKKRTRLYLLTFKEYSDLCVRYSLDLSDLSYLSAEPTEKTEVEKQTDKTESSLEKFVGEKQEEKPIENEADMSDKADKQNENLKNYSKPQVSRAVSPTSSNNDNKVLNISRQGLTVERVLYELQQMGGEAGILALANRLRVQEGQLRLFLQENSKYFIVSGPFVYTKARWNSLRSNGGSNEVLGERSL